MRHYVGSAEHIGAGQFFGNYRNTAVVNTRLFGAKIDEVGAVDDKDAQLVGFHLVLELLYGFGRNFGRWAAHWRTAKYLKSFAIQIRSIFWRIPNPTGCGNMAADFKKIISRRFLSKFFWHKSFKTH